MSEPTDNEVQEFGDFLAEQFGGTKDEPAEQPVAEDSAEESGAEPESVSAEPEVGEPSEVQPEAEAPEPTEESAEADAGDTPADAPDADNEVSWEKRYKDLQAFTDRKLAETEQSVEQRVQQAVQEQMMQMQAQQQQVAAQQPVDMNVLSEQVKNDPATTFQLAIQQRPDLVPNVIGMIAEHHGAVEAEQARSAFGMIQQQQQQMMMQQQFEAIEQERMAERAPQMLEQGINEIVDGVANNPEYKEVFTELEEPAANILKAEWEGYTERMGNPPPPDQWQGLVEKSFLRAWQQQTAANATKTDAPPAPPHVETGGANTVKEPSKAESIADAIVGHYGNGIY